MAIRPVDLQTSLSKTVEVDKMRQAQQQHQVGEQQYSDELDKRVKKEAQSIAESEKAEQEKDIDDYESEKRKSKREQDRGEKKAEEDVEETEDSKLKKSTYKDPNRGGNIDFTG
ncbi:MAG: hypothetical protein QGH40_05365 [bacterium]|jgi:hypothetical protein|nr:hypothetical protein [bacterium]